MPPAAEVSTEPMLPQKRCDDEAKRLARGAVEGERKPNRPKRGGGGHCIDRTKSAFANYCCGSSFSLFAFFLVAIELVRLEDLKIAPPRGKSRWLHHLTHENESGGAASSIFFPLSYFFL